VTRPRTAPPDCGCREQEDDGLVFGSKAAEGCTHSISWRTGGRAEFIGFSGHRGGGPVKAADGGSGKNDLT
jgi:hypothetical protein